MGKINWNKSLFHIVSNLHAVDIHGLPKTLLCGFKMLPSLYYLCQTHLITWNLGFFPDAIIKSSNGFISRQASVSCTQTLHPFTASISAATGQNAFAHQSLPNREEPERAPHRICTFMEAAARLWNMAQAWSQELGAQLWLTLAGTAREPNAVPEPGGTHCHPSQSSRSMATSEKAWAVQATIVTCSNRSYAAFLQVFITTSPPATAVRPSRSFRTRRADTPGRAVAPPGRGSGGPAGSGLARRPRPSAAGPATPLPGSGGGSRAGPAHTSAARETLPSPRAARRFGRAAGPAVPYRGEPRAPQARSSGKEPLGLTEWGPEEAPAPPGAANPPPLASRPRAASRLRRRAGSGTAAPRRRPPPARAAAPPPRGEGTYEHPPCPGPASAARGGGVTPREGAGAGPPAGGRCRTEWGGGAGAGSAPGLRRRCSGDAGLRPRAAVPWVRPSLPVPGRHWRGGAALPAAPQKWWLSGSEMGRFGGRGRKRNLYKVQELCWEISVRDLKALGQRGRRCLNISWLDGPWHPGLYQQLCGQWWGQWLCFCTWQQWGRASSTRFGFGALILKQTLRCWSVSRERPRSWWSIWRTSLMRSS